MTLVLDLLFKMGYGGSRADVEQVGRSGDGGIDGIIKEDKLGLDIIYVQAKRWKSNIGSGVVRDFSGSLDTKGAHRGLLISTSEFTSDARKVVEDSKQKRIILIGGDRLAELMMEHQVGVSVVDSYDIYRLDTGYFE